MEGGSEELLIVGLGAKDGDTHFGDGGLVLSWLLTGSCVVIWCLRSVDRMTSFCAEVKLVVLASGNELNRAPPSRPLSQTPICITSKFKLVHLS